MNFWSFLDRNWFWIIGPVVLIAMISTDGCKRETSASGCGVRIEIGSKRADRGTPQ